MARVLGVVGVILMTLSPALGYWFVLSHYLEQRHAERRRTHNDVHTRIAANKARNVEYAGGLEGNLPLGCIRLSYQG